MRRAGMNDEAASRLLQTRDGVEYIGETDVPVNSLAGLALAPLMDGRLKFTPERYAKTYQTWLENLRDWPISRQLWWGHRIPVWSKPGDHRDESRAAVLFRKITTDTGEEITYACTGPGQQDEERRLESDGFVRDTDVLDTWFSSALWPFSTLGWPESTQELDTFYPGNVLCTAREIITLWVSRMVMMGQYDAGDIPFRDVFIHAMLQDGEGRKMSKSLGNGIDPLEIISSHGADAMRFTLCDMTTQTQDVRMPVETMTLPDGREVNTSPKFDLGRNFCNKLWNATRFVLGGIEEEPAAFDLNESDLQFADRWILARAARTAAETTRNLEAMDFNPAVTAVYDFVWRDFCDWYLELTKPRLREGGRSAATAQRVLGYVLDVSLRLLHPVVPFVTEALWEKVSEVLDRRTGDELLERQPSKLLVTARWPDGLSERFETLAETDGADVVETMERLQGIVRAIRNIRARMNIPPKNELDVIIAGAGDWRPILESNRQFIGEMARVGSLDLPEGDETPENAAVEVFGEMRVYVKLDPELLEKERARLRKRIEQAEKKLAGSDKKLANENFVTRAKPEVIARERELNEKLRTELKGLHESLEQLG
jgi:valyl-tRNA synthetase